MGWPKLNGKPKIWPSKELGAWRDGKLGGVLKIVEKIGRMW